MELYSPKWLSSECLWSPDKAVNARRLALLRALLGRDGGWGERSMHGTLPWPSSVYQLAPLLQASVCGCVFSVCVRRTGDRAALRMGPFYNLLTLWSCLLPLLATVNGISMPWKVTRWHSSCCSKGPRVVLWKAAERIGEDCDLQWLISGMSFGACLKRMQTFLTDCNVPSQTRQTIPIRFSTVTLGKQSS